MSDEIEMRAVVVARQLAASGRLSVDTDTFVRDVAATIATAMEDVCAEAFAERDAAKAEADALHEGFVSMVAQRDRLREALMRVEHCTADIRKMCLGVPGTIAEAAAVNAYEEATSALAAKGAG